jgi:hypothetical protein
MERAVEQYKQRRTGRIYPSGRRLDLIRFYAKYQTIYSLSIAHELSYGHDLHCGA